MQKQNASLQLQAMKSNALLKLPKFADFNLPMVKMTLAPPSVLDYNSKVNLEKRLHCITFAELSFKLDHQIDPDTILEQMDQEVLDVPPSIALEKLPIPTLKLPKSDKYTLAKHNEHILPPLKKDEMKLSSKDVPKKLNT